MARTMQKRRTHKAANTTEAAGSSQWVVKNILAIPTPKTDPHARCGGNDRWRAGRARNRFVFLAHDAWICDDGIERATAKHSAGIVRGVAMAGANSIRERMSVARSIPGATS